jgi:hypothetical protein
MANEPTNYGWNVPNTPFKVGGYIDATYGQEQKSQFQFDDISLLFSGHQNHFDMLGEIEISHLKLDDNTDVKIILEQLQVSYSFENHQRVTVGRFHSDIGYWNQAPINILQDTTTIPHIVENVFPKATTGLMYQKDIGEEDSLSLTLQDNHDIGSRDDSIVSNRHFAMSYHGVTSDDFSWRMAGGTFRRENINELAYYVGGGLQYENDILTLQSELFTQHSDNSLDIPYSAYLQSVWHFKDRQDAVVRLERYKDDILGVNESISLLGYAYRPLRNMVLKAEYIHHTQLPLSRFVYSFSVLF